MPPDTYPLQSRVTRGSATSSPPIVTPRSQVRFWFGVQRTDAEQIREAYDILGEDRSQVFRVRYESAVEITTGPVAGIIEEFMYYRSIHDQTDEVIT